MNPSTIAQVAGCLGGILFLLFILWRLFMHSLYSLFGQELEEMIKRHRAACIDCGKPILCEQDDGCVTEFPEDDDDPGSFQGKGRSVHGA